MLASERAQLLLVALSFRLVFSSEIVQFLL